MHSTLIRFTDRKFADSYRRGELYLSSLSKYWDFSEGKIRFGTNLTAADIAKIKNTVPDGRQDFSEGVAAQIPRDQVAHFFDSMENHIIHDVRFRLSAYQYCNLLCFFRIDAEDTDAGLLDEENMAYILRSRGSSITAEEIKAMVPAKAQKLAVSLVEPNPMLSSDRVHMIQLPSVAMNQFGDVVIVIKDQKEFEQRILAAVKRQGGRAILGDVRYHPMLDRVDPTTMQEHSVTIVTSRYTNEAGRIVGDGAFHISMLDGMKNIFWRGCMDKYDRYASQKEWRICWLPNARNYEPEILQTGSLEDIIDVVETRDIRDYLLKKYKGYIPGIVSSVRRELHGTESYRDFKEYMKTVDGLGDFVAEIGGKSQTCPGCEETDQS